MSEPFDIDNDDMAELMAELEAQNAEVMAQADSDEAAKTPAPAAASSAPQAAAVVTAEPEPSLEELEALDGEITDDAIDETLLDVEAGLAAIEQDHKDAEAAEMKAAQAAAAAKKKVANPWAAAAAAKLKAMSEEDGEEGQSEVKEKESAKAAEDKAKADAALKAEEEQAKLAKLAKEAEQAKLAKLAKEKQEAEAAAEAKRVAAAQAAEEAERKRVAEAAAAAAAEEAAKTAAASVPRPTEDTPAGSSKLKFTIDPVQFQKDTRVTEATLDNCMIEQASLRAFYGTQAAQAEAQASRAKHRFEVVEATLYDAHRKALAATEEKVTEKMVENAVKKDVRWLKAKNTVIDAETIAAINKSMVDSLRDRKDMLVQLGADRREGLKGQLRMMADQESREGLAQRATAAASAAFAQLQNKAA